MLHEITDKQPSLIQSYVTVIIIRMDIVCWNIDKNFDEAIYFKPSV